MNKILPLIVGAINHGAVKPVGCEDQEELQADGCAMAAAMIHSAELKGKEVAPGTVAFYTLQALRSGRRSGYCGRQDVMCAGVALDGLVQLKSMDEATGVDLDGDDISLHDLLAAPGEDTEMAVARKLDWAEVLDQLDERRVSVLRETTAGYGPSEIAVHIGVSAPRVVQLRRGCGEQIKTAWAGTGIVDAMTPPIWRSGLRATAERRAGRAGRTM